MSRRSGRPLITRFYHRVFRVWRARRFARLMVEFEPAGTELVLDIGGYPGGWGMWRERVRRIDCLNLTPVGGTLPDGYRYLVGDGCALEMSDRSYDLAYSNSVIEHVGGIEQQRAFAAEARRVGRAVWVQTPARECPIEPHFLLPFVHWLPDRWRRRLVLLLSPRRWLFGDRREALVQVLDATRLLSRREMEELFPDCRILTERLAWLLPKSHIAIRMVGTSGPARPTWPPPAA